MKIHLASSDEQILRLCHDVLGEVLGGGWAVHLARGMRPECEADLYIWDVQEEHDTVEVNPADEWRNVFLVNRAAVGAVRQLLPRAEATVLVKPVTRAALTAVLTDASKLCKTASASDDSVIKSLRADRDDILQCLMETSLKLQEYDSDRTNFLARAIHDFRAPLTAITGYCGLLLSEEMGHLTDPQREVIERMHRSGLKLSRMASAMFQLSISPRVELTLDIERGEIRDSVEQALHEIMPAAEEKRVAISFDVAPSPEHLYFDRSRFEQVLVNVLENACRFVPKGGSIEIAGYPFFWDRRTHTTTGSGIGSNRRAQDNCSPNAYRIDVHDNGPGIPAPRLGTIFEEYTSYGGCSDRAGGGLGLAICRMIMGQHKGRIWAENESGGTVFCIVLPFHRQTAITMPAQPVAKLARATAV